eukprot:2062928-Pyramimonas_sp.AAC.1
MAVESPVLQTPTAGLAGNGQSVDDCSLKRKLPFENAEASPTTPHGQGFQGQDGQQNKHQRVYARPSSKD